MNNWQSNLLIGAPAFKLPPQLHIFLPKPPNPVGKSGEPGFTGNSLAAR